MNFPIVAPLAMIAPTSQQVLDACREAEVAGRTYLSKCLIAGCLLREYRAFLRSQDAPNSFLCDHKARSSHGETNPANEGHKDGFELWLRANGLSKPTAYRWMQASERVSRHALGMDTASPFTGVIDIDSASIPMSQALLAPEAELPAQALEYRQAMFDFAANHTLAEALRAAVEGDSPANRITRAANGQAKGGAPDPDARKELAHYAGRALAECLSHIGARVNKQGGHWTGMGSHQKQQAREYLDLWVAGLDVDLLVHLSESLAREIKARKGGKRAEPAALKAAVTKALADIAIARHQRKGAPAPAPDQAALNLPKRH